MESQEIENTLYDLLLDYRMYDFSKTCTCDEAHRIGETFCCNNCGLPSTTKTV